MTAPAAPVRSVLLFVSTFLFPAVGFPLVTYAWWVSSGRQWPFVAVVMGAPVAFGYLMPWILTHVIKRWRFTTGPRMGSYYVHHGFIYGSKLALALLLVARSIPSIVAPLEMIAVVLVTGAATAFGGWWHDVNAVRAGKIEIDGGSEALTAFAPVSYFSMGATYAAVVLWAYRVLAADGGALVWVLPSAFALLCIIPSIVFLAIDPPARRVLLDRLTRAES